MFFVQLSVTELLAAVPLKPVTAVRAVDAAVVLTVMIDAALNCVPLNAYIANLYSVFAESPFTVYEVVALLDVFTTSFQAPFTSCFIL